jgi:hypothetical protein
MCGTWTTRYREVMATLDDESGSLEQDLPTIIEQLRGPAQAGLAALLGEISIALDAYVYFEGDALALHAGVEREGVAEQISGDGWIVMVIATAGLLPGMPSVIALAIETAIAHDRSSSSERERTSGERLLRMLADPDRAAAIADMPSRPYVCIVARGDVAMLQAGAQGWMDSLRGRDPYVLAGNYEDEFVALVAEDPSLGNAEFIRSAMASEGVSWGVSAPVTYWREVRSSYQGAVTALAAGKILYGDGGVGDLATLGAYRLLSLVPDSEALRVFLRDTLGDLATREDVEAADLRRTLSALLNNNLNIAESARELHFHYNTVRYRLAKLEELLGKFSADAELRLSLSLALRVLQLRGR